MTADLAEEHSTSTLATERLEAKTAQRMKLDKDSRSEGQVPPNISRARETRNGGASDPFDRLEW